MNALNLPFAWWLAVLAAVSATVLVGVAPVRGFWRHTLAAAFAFAGVFVIAIVILNHYQIGT